MMCSRFSIKKLELRNFFSEKQKKRRKKTLLMVSLIGRNTDVWILANSLMFAEENSLNIDFVVL